MSEEQKKQLIQAVLTAVITLVLAIATIFGYNVVIPPQAPADFGVMGLPAGNVVCNSSSTGDCLRVTSGQDISVYADRAAATRTFRVEGGTGAITGYVLQYGSQGQRIVCGSTTITGTGTIAHGLATPSYVTSNIAADATGDGLLTTHTNTTATVTLKVWNSAATPAAATTPVAVNWCVIGTP